jgi:hypothetical protein
VVWQYDNFVANYSSRAEDRGTYLYGDQGVLFVGRYGYWVRPASDTPFGQATAKPAFEAKKVQSRDEGPSNAPSFESDTGKHIKNFLECVKTRQRPVADIEIAATSTIPTLMGGLSIRNGGKTIAFTGTGAKPLA